MDARKVVTSKNVSLLVWIALASCIFIIATNKRQYEWDFRILRSAPAALSTGENPYDGTNSHFHYPDELPFLYPPITLYAFQPLSKVSERTARAAWLAAKLLALAGLVLLWHRHFESLSASFRVVLFLALGYNATLLRDLAAGNISIFEQLGIWFSFYLLLRNRPYWAGLILAVTAQFKLVPAALLGMLLFVGPPGRWKPFAASIAAFVGLLSLNLVLVPQLTADYFRALTSANPSLDERGELGPSALALIRDVADGLASSGLNVSHWVPNVAYLAYVATFALAILWMARKYSGVLASRDPRWMIYLGCVVYVLTMPRIKDYSYIILLIPSLFMIRQITLGTIRPALPAPLIAVLVFIPARDSYVPGLATLLPWVQSYLPWLVAWWMLYYFAGLLLGSRDSETLDMTVTYKGSLAELQRRLATASRPDRVAVDSNFGTSKAHER
jgi:hypothetical protein